MKKTLLFSFAGMFLFLNSYSQVTVSPTGGPSSIASFLTGYGVTISNVVVTGDSNAIGYFAANNTNLNMPAGLALTTGSIYTIPGPNNSTCASAPSVTAAGDADLTTLAGTQTFDACVLEFDCVPLYDTLYFNYLFGSEEYPEFVNGAFNDIFAIFISGPNLPFQNMALLPNTTIAVSVNNVNNGFGNSGPCTNCLFYVDNTNDTMLQYDGTTTNLLAQIPVTPNATYHFKIAVADASDGAFDSGVLLQGGSFRTANPNGIASAANENGISMFPVPVNNAVNFNFKTLADPNVRFVIRSLSGQEILAQTITVGTNGNATLDVSAFGQGVYAVEIIADGIRSVKQLVVAGK
jgi:hypothetical protein